MTSKIRLLQAEHDPKYRLEIANHFGSLDDFTLFSVDLGDQLLATIREQKPQIVFLNVDLPPRGAFPLLKQIRSEWDKDSMFVILFSQKDFDDSLVAKAGELGATYFMLRPVDMLILEQRVRQIIANNILAVDHEVLSPKRVQEICVSYFDAMGVPPHYKGYRYLIEGVWLAILYPEWLGAMTKKLYPAVGQRFGTTASQVERAMRYALDVTWEKGNLDELYRFFPYEIRENRGKPTNSIFIAKIADLVTFELT